jgi:hypothetical protein
VVSEALSRRPGATTRSRDAPSAQGRDDVRDGATIRIELVNGSLQVTYENPLQEDDQ